VIRDTKSSLLPKDNKQTMKTNLGNIRQLLCLLTLCYPGTAFSSLTPGLAKKSLIIQNGSPISGSSSLPSSSSLLSQSQLFRIPRGGSTSVDENNQKSVKQQSSTALAFISPLTIALQNAGTSYSNALTAYPILTKSLTACLTFLLSDYTAQYVERPSSDDTERKNWKFNWTRTFTSAAVGLLYFGPAAHAWYEMIFTLLPGTTLFSTLQKAILGQLIFGPAFTCVFFATFLLQDGSFSIGNWVKKIKSDLPGAWLAGVGFWPLVDFVSFALVPIKFIPLFINLMSFIWTIYLSMVASR
jgi:protein Mpv17